MNNPLKNLPTTLASAWPWLALGCAGLALVASLAAFAPNWLALRHLTKQHQRLKAEGTQAAAEGEAAHTDYRLDSAALAARQQALHLQDSTLAQSEREILSTRPARLRLPAREQLPREGAN